MPTGDPIPTLLRTFPSLTLTLAAACGDPGAGDTPATGVVVTDSAGIEVVDISAEVLDALPVWTFSGEPMLTIGKTTGEDPYLFARIQDALRLPGGEIVVLEGFDFEFRIFGADGLFRASFGGRGEGPGEFGEIVGLSKRTQGGIAVADNRLRRVTLFDDQGVVSASRSTACPADGWYFNDISLCYFGGFTADGAAFWYGTRRSGGRQPGINPGALQRTPGGIRYLALRSGDSTQVIDSVSGRSRARVVQMRGGVPALWSVPEIFEPEGHWAFGPRSVALGESARFEIRLRDSSGELRRVLRVAREPEFVTSAQLDSIRLLMGTPASISPEDLALQYLDDVQAGGQIPFFSELRFDDAGRLWVADYVPPRVLLLPDTIWWTVFDRDALPLARMATGRSDNILELGEDHVLLRETDEMDVQRVAMYRIERE
ncbi:MAG: hypothetical protein F4087_04685 [Gemmatimonadetes bacterium]|nr:hypothetical protein [Gemmatimonadota bacterium]MYE70519.1 hypothetical protein [Gemmatimonadota bacterium]MYJ67798.1 hypothetical protein [Gemmatimonadota bacterium]